MIFADPKNDIAFKKIFGNEQHKNTLISFLNSVLDFQGKSTIVDVELANPYQVPRIPELKETIFDIKATNQNGENFIVEMQKKDLGDFTKRSLYYTSKVYVAQLPKGTDYTRLKKVYFIGILNFNIFENKEFISRHLIINQETKTQDIKDFEFTFLELEKFQKGLDELDSVLDKWVYFLKNASDLTVVPKEYEEISEFKEAFEIATQTAWNKKELEVYEYITLKEFDELNALQTAEKKGMEKGIAKGMEKGIVKGIEKGTKNTQIEIAKNALVEGVDVKTISLITGLDEDFINVLAKE